jgi:hypothetical protein
MAIPVPGAPALPLHEIYDGLCRNCLGPRNAHHVQKDEKFGKLRRRAHQIFYIHLWAKATLGIGITRGSFERAFNCARFTVRAVLLNGHNEPKQRGRRLAVDVESEASILAWIQRNYDKSTPTTRTEIRHYCSTKLNQEMTKGWVDSLLGRHPTEFIETTSTPHEEPRMQIARIFLDETRWAMNEAVQMRSSDLVFNLDEVGRSK